MEAFAVAFAAELVVEVGPGTELVAAVGSGEQEMSSRRHRTRSRTAPPFLVVRCATINTASQWEDK